MNQTGIPTSGDWVVSNNELTKLVSKDYGFLV